MQLDGPIVRPSIVLKDWLSALTFQKQTESLLACPPCCQNDYTMEMRFFL